MSKIMLVNVTHVEESRVAVVDDGILAEYEIETTNRTSLKGNIHNVVVESVHPNLEAAFVRIGQDLKGFLPLDEVNFKLLPARGESRKLGRIGQHLHPGQKLMAQVVREPFAGKPPTVSTYFSLPGRFLVLMPGVDSSGISRKIDDGVHRDRLRKILSELKPPEGFGLIVRTAGVGQTKAELQRDLRYLLRLWESIQRSSQATEFPGLVYREADLVIRTIRDHFTPDIGEVWIDSKETFERALTFVKDVMPNRARTIKLYSGERPLFNKYNLEEQIERIYKRRVPLPSGGEIVIDGTEALTAIDVNSARSKRETDAEDNAAKTNLEAAVEIARQLRLRDQGGLVVVDFIDMMATRNKKKVEKAIRDAMRSDRARHDITVISKLGLMEIARQRLKSAKLSVSYATCPNCDGHGLIKNVEPAALAALRKLQTRAARADVGKIRVDLPVEVAGWLQNNKREELLYGEHRYGVRIEIVADEKLLRHETRFTTSPREKTDEAPAAEIEKPAAEQARRAEPAAPSTPAQAAPGQDPATPAKPTEPTEPDAKAGETKTGEAKGGEAKGGEPGDEGAAAPNGRPKRRRKRRRKPRSAAPTSPDAKAKSKASADAPPQEKREKKTNPDDVPLAVPRGVRADELMPAASGSAGRGGKPKNKNGAPRPRKSGSRPRSRRGGSRRGGDGAAKDGSATGNGGS